MDFLRFYVREFIASGVLFLAVFILRYIVAKLIKKYATHSEILDNRANLVIKYFNILWGILTILALLTIWGVHPENLFITFSSIFAVIGVAMFAQWSILSNITAGIILFFSSPFKIGNTIIIHDKDFPIEAEIIDIRAFYTYLRTKEGINHTYPNNLLLQKGITVVNNFREDIDFTD
jgi:small-conductance mechanosensitive channel